MSKDAGKLELAQIERFIAAKPDGLGISELEGALAANGVVINRRTLLRRLNALVDQKRIVAEGVLKGRVYKKPVPQSRGAEVSAAEEAYENYIPLSEAGREILSRARRPIQAREPVGYRRDFLLAYRPNETSYLGAVTCKHLFTIGWSHNESDYAGTFARQVMGRLLIDLSWASSYLEGNTYSLLETERLIAFGQAAEGKDALETQMILNHKQAIEFLVESAEEIGVNRYTILNLHAILSDNLLPNPDACGRLRSIPVGIGGSVYTPLSTPQLLEEYFQLVLETAAAIADPFEQAFFALVHLSYLQPFEDVNKRVARLSANIPLIKHNLCPLSFIDVPKRAYVEGILGVYENNRTDLLRDIFVWAYERSVKRYLAARQELGEPDPFRLRYRSALIEVVGAIVKQAMPDETGYLRAWAAHNIPEEDQPKFLDMVRSELNALHEGNIARFRIRPSEFSTWQEARKRG